MPGIESYSLPTSDKIIIRDLNLRGIIGVHDWERRAPRDILVNVVIYTDLQPAGISDSLTETVDYSMVAEKMAAHVSSTARYTLEALAEDLAKLCLQLPRVQGVCLRVEKPGAVPAALSVGVEIERIHNS